MTSSCEEEQKDELDALRSIYEGDPCFSEVSKTVFQYKFGEEGTGHSFLLEIQWPESYPVTSSPKFQLDLFYNHHLIPEVKDLILSRLDSESENLLGMAATFTLIESVKENLFELMEDQPISIQSQNAEQGLDKTDSGTKNIPDKEKKSILSKAQKRKMWDRGEANEEKPRGYNWVDIIKHLSQTGSQTFKED